MATNTSPYYPYRSAKAKVEYLAAYDQTANEWPIDADDVGAKSRLVPTSFGKTFVRIGGPPGGQPLVLLPGMGATSLLWAANIEAFSKTASIYWDCLMAAGWPPSTRCVFPGGWASWCCWRRLRAAPATGVLHPRSIAADG
jgi:hypothetical protein